MEEAMKGWVTILKGEQSDLMANDEKNPSWRPIDEVDEPQSRQVVDSELIFDIDGDDYEPARMLAQNLENELFSQNIPFLRFTSGRLFHYSVFIDHASTFDPAHMIDYYKKNKSEFDKRHYVYNFAKKMRYAVFKYILDKVAPVKGANIDCGLMKSKRHLIRICGGRHSSGYYKSLLSKIPDHQPHIKKDDVVYPKSINYWFVNDFITSFAYKYHLRPIVHRGKRDKKQKHIKWIEKIFEIEIDDGRHRVVNLILAPYLVNIVGMDVDKATDKIYEWVEHNKELSYTQITRDYIKYQVEYALKRELQPLSKASLRYYFSEKIQKKLCGYYYDNTLKGFSK